MRKLIQEIERIYKESNKAFSYDAMNFDSRMDAIKEWQMLLCPENVNDMIEHIKYLEQQIEDLESALLEAQERCE